MKIYRWKCDSTGSQCALKEIPDNYYQHFFEGKPTRKVLYGSEDYFKIMREALRCGYILESDDEPTAFVSPILNATGCVVDMDEIEARREEYALENAEYYEEAMYPDEEMEGDFQREMLDAQRDEAADLKMRSRKGD